MPALLFIYYQRQPNYKQSVFQHNIAMAFLCLILISKNPDMKKCLSLITIGIFFTLNGYSFTQVVTVKNHVFTPASFTINLGDTIRWTWVDGSHTTTSTTIPVNAISWSKSINSSSTTFTYVPAVSGTYNYKCIPHASMGMVANLQ